jgi:hypothetical protein
VPVSPRRLLDAEELDLEDEGGRRGNDGREAALAVRVVRGECTWGIGGGV